VSWFDAARYCNWEHNECPTGVQDASTTERGAYTLDGATSGGLDITRNPGAKYWIPSEDEWYKAAYHQPQSEGGPVDDYWDYPTRSDEPNAPGNTIGPAENQANITVSGNYSVTQSGSYDSNQNYLTDGGSYEGSAGPYGTFDQGGNVREWNDAVISDSFRGVWGGSWNNDELDLRSSSRDFEAPDCKDNLIGFRVASP
jgi:formylglycine-generating enzyme required for sulfatase activity